MQERPGRQDAANPRAGGVWDDLVGQPHAVTILRQAADAALGLAAGAPASAMSQSWLITGPPGSGRSNAAKAFAAALQCDAPGAPGTGCGQCRPCRTALAGTHPDVLLMRTEVLSIGIDAIRQLVLRAAMSPSIGRWLVVVVEDADRLTEQAADALLKSIEEPPPRTVWLLCTPTVDDVAPTIRSRCRHLLLRTPAVEAVAAFLVARHGADPALALLGARAAQGHIGRARALATDDGVRARHDAVISLPARLTGPAAAALAAADLVTTASADADAASATAAAGATARLRRQLGLIDGTRPDRAAQAALKDLADEQETKAKRAVRTISTGRSSIWPPSTGTCSPPSSVPGAPRSTNTAGPTSTSSPGRVSRRTRSAGSTPSSPPGRRSRSTVRRCWPSRRWHSLSCRRRHRPSPLAHRVALCPS